MDNLKTITLASAGERHRLPVGPVTLAIRAMRRNEAPSWEARQSQIIAEERAALRALRARIDAQFAADAALLEGVDA